MAISPKFIHRNPSRLLPVFQHPLEQRGLSAAQRPGDQHSWVFSVPWREFHRSAFDVPDRDEPRHPPADPACSAADHLVNVFIGRAGFFGQSGVRSGAHIDAASFHVLLQLLALETFLGLAAAHGATAAVGGGIKGPDRFPPPPAGTTRFPCCRR